MPRIRASSIEKHHEVMWQAITDAVGALLEEHDYASITLGQIADRAGIARNSLYRYASDKTALMFAVADRVSTPVRARVEEIAQSTRPAPARVELIIDELLRAFEDKPLRLILQPVALLAIHSPDIRDHEVPLGDIARSIEGVVTAGIANGDFRAAASAPLTAWLLSGVVRAAADAIITAHHHPDELAPLVSDLVLGALRG